MNRGSIVIEGLASMFVVVSALLFNLELCRRAHYEVLLHFAAFTFVRQLVLGESERVAQKPFVRLVRLSGGRRPKLRWSFSFPPRRTLEGKVHLRYEALWTFPGKHHFEITRKCRF